MKKLMFLISLLFLLSLGCQKDEVITGLESELAAKIDNANAPDDPSFRSPKAVKMVPLKGEIIQIPDGNPLDCFGIPVVDHFTDISGHLTHLGNVAGGTSEVPGCRMETRDGVPTIIADIVGHFRAANDDILTFEGEIWVAFVNGVQVGGNAFQITADGTGRWENADGYFTISLEPLEDGTIWYSVDGYVTPPGKNK
ncbi:MAG: hypothetical protein HKN87_02615 [Saprospiraceae bacterium]|nr:hypothetical protein [Saprospiraceae bacterium]